MSGSVMNADSLRLFLEPAVIQKFDGKYKERPSEWDKVFKPEKAIEARWQVDAGISGFGMPQEMSEGGIPFFDKAQETFRKTYTHRQWGLGFALTEQMVDDAEAIDLAALFADHLAISMKEGKEWNHADYINGAFSTSIGGDGVALVSAFHPLARGGVASNYIGSIDLSEAALENVRATVMTAVDDTGRRISLQMKDLVFGPNEWGNATRITRSERRAGTSDNDINVAKGMLTGGLLELTRLTNPKAWFVTTDSPRGLRHLWRKKLQRKSAPDPITGNLRFFSKERYSFGHTEWRGIYGADPA